MPTDYDAIADRYQRAKGHPWRTHIEAYSFLERLGDLTGKSVVDLACGEGHYTRMLRALGASRVLGIDRSEGMIALAQAQEQGDPHGVEYLARDCRDLGIVGEFDEATAAYLLNYASTRDELSRMVREIARCLKPGGRFVTVNANPEIDFNRGESYRKYRFEIRASGEPREGMPYTWVFELEDGPVEVENYRLPLSAHEEAFKAAGFKEVRRHAPRISKASRTAFPPDFWNDFLNHPPIVIFECLL